MPEPAFRDHVIDAIRAQPGVTVVDLGNGTVQIAIGTDIRVIHLDPLVPRNFLSTLERWYKVPRAAWYPPSSFQMKSNTERKIDTAG